jgi:hypothetical protein
MFTESNKIFILGMLVGVIIANAIYILIIKTKC